MSATQECSRCGVNVDADRITTWPYDRRVEQGVEIPLVAKLCPGCASVRRQPRRSYDADK